MIKIRPEINELENRKSIQKIKVNNTQSFQNVNTIELLARTTKKMMMRCILFIPDMTTDRHHRSLGQ